MKNNDFEHFTTQGDLNLLNFVKSDYKLTFGSTKELIYIHTNRFSGSDNRDPY